MINQQAVGFEKLYHYLSLPFRNMCRCILQCTVHSSTEVGISKTYWWQIPYNRLASVKV